MNDYSFLVEYRIREALLQAEQDRLVRQAQMARASRQWYAGLLAALGEWLAARGSELQVRFGQPTPKPTILSAEAPGWMAAP